MKLIKIYSNDERFKTVYFSDGLNLIVGKTNKQYDLSRDRHNLGKTTLISLIDFLLLKEIDKNFFLKKTCFENHIFFLELETIEKKYITIKRAVKNNSKISIKISSEKNNNFTNELNWDYIDLPLTSSNNSKNPKFILNNLLNFNTLNEYGYRKIINYFLRNQKDYIDTFQLSKFKGNDASWKPILFELLGFDNTSLKEKYKLSAELEKKENYIKKIEKDFDVNHNEIDKLNGLIQIKENEKQNILETINKFNFYIKEQGLNKELIENIEEKISKLNTEQYNLEYEINNLKDSIYNEVTFDINSTEKIFKEVNIYFTEQLKKSYEDLIKFNTQITTERNKHIKSTLLDKEYKLLEVKKELTALNSRRQDILSLLKETDTFKKYKSFEMDLIKIEREIATLESKIENASVAREEIQEVYKIRNRIASLSTILGDLISNPNNTRYINIKNTFSKLVNSIIMKPGLLSINQNKNGNIDFEAEIIDENGATTSEADGFTYRKILCACFDLSIIINYLDKNFVRFVYHDGCLESLDPRKQYNYLKLIEELCNKYDIQYILTAIESDITKNNYKFNTSPNIAVSLSDDDDKSNLFGFKF
ncbi:DUF2326 domain-containing protein [Clostridium cuniculi]|uniref:DUF2326 domain-containing protein n=1 Tax=Clostridium cuniculi TaxID=2548455 RepID=UPI00105527F1|nr:DUF2326 domain-containing protein [Clostridium cuniculi]